MAHRGSSCKSLLECPVCLEDLSSNEPRYLNCHHTVCTPCLDSLIDNHGGSEIACPTCRKVTPKPPGGAKELPVDFRILSIAEFLSQKQPVPLCSSCSGDRLAGAVCHTCAVWLCGPCRQRHDDIKMFHDHRVEILSQTEDDSVGCTIHKKPVLYTCLQCEPCTDMCTVCVLNHGKTDHVNIVKLSDEIIKQHTKFEDLKGSVKTKLEQIEEFLNKYQRVEQDISAHVEQIKSEIDKQANNIRGELSSKSGYIKATDAKEKLQDILKTTHSDIPVKQTSDQINTLKRLTEHLEEQLNDSAKYEYRVPELNKYMLGIFRIFNLFWKGSQDSGNVFQFTKPTHSDETPKTGTLRKTKIAGFKTSDRNTENTFSTAASNPNIFGAPSYTKSSPKNLSSLSPPAGFLATPASISVPKSTTSKSTSFSPFDQPISTAVQKTTTSQATSVSFLGQPISTAVPKTTTSKVISVSPFGQTISTAVPNSTTVTSTSPLRQPTSTTVPVSKTSRVIDTDPLGCTGLFSAVPKSTTSSGISSGNHDSFSLFSAPSSAADPRNNTSSVVSSDSFGTATSKAVPKTETSSAATNIIFSKSFTTKAFP